MVGAFAAGVGLSLQSRMNGAVAAHSGQWIVAALWSFGSGLIVLTLGLLVSRSMRAGWFGIRDALREGRLRWWQCIGGIAGAILVAVQSWSVPIVGVAIFSVGVVGGQTLNALLVDRLGLGPAGIQAVTVSRVVAAVVAVVGVVVSATAHRSGGSFAVWPALAAFAAGALMAGQQATNARVSVANGSPMATTWQNFFVGTIALLVMSAVILARTGTAGWGPPTGVPWWAWWGGLVGIVFIAITAWAVRHTGVLLFGLLSVAGQLLAALCLDLLDPVTRGDVSAQLVLGLGITLLAAMGAGVAARRR
ncbi:DMT family transporter [Calidifontibacter sp. DB0510]|uniref:DMT family transporter n=1 Tax=Metallococcus carri TaxID=1656884 RepID=A0A967B3I9_9MICO|nr:DMT family transporter [Metallococcus carri]NHN56605.1 DMT family transporter [Metallococcus carri]